MNEKELEEIKEKVNRSNKYILYVETNDIKNLIKYIEKLRNDIEEERNFNKSLLETLKECVNKDYLDKMISFKDGEIEKLKEAYQTLKDDIEGHRIAYVDTPEFEENYISKDKIEKLKDELKELQHFKEEVIDIIKYADDTAEPTYWNIRKLLGLGEEI